MLETLPKDLSAPEARERVAKALGKLQRQIGDLQQAILDRDRIVQRQQEELICAQTRIANLEAKLDDARGGGDDTAYKALQGELERWRGVAVATLAAVEALATKALVPARPAAVSPSPPPAGSSTSLTGSTEFRPPEVGEEDGAGEDTGAPREGGSTESRAAGGKVCAVAWCAQKCQTKAGYCVTHWGRWTNHGDPLLVKRRIGGVLVLCRETAQGVFTPVNTATE